MAANTITTMPEDEKAVKGFVLLDANEGHLTIYRAGKKTKFLNHGKQPLEYPPGSKNLVPVATQEQLKEVYDAHHSYAQFVKPPSGYEAPWKNKQ